MPCGGPVPTEHEIMKGNLNDNGINPKTVQKFSENELRAWNDAMMNKMTVQEIALAIAMFTKENGIRQETLKKNGHPEYSGGGDVESCRPLGAMSTRRRASLDLQYWPPGPESNYSNVVSITI